MGICRSFSHRTTMAPRTPEQIVMMRHFYKHRRLVSTLNTLNCLFIFVALGLVGLGVYFSYKYDWGDELVGAPLPYVIVGIGIVLLLLNMCGFIGTNKRKRTCLLLYFTFLLFIMAAETSISVLALTYRRNLEEQLYQGWLDASPEAKDKIQARFDCCGWYTISDNPGPSCTSETTGKPPCAVAVTDWISEKLVYVYVGGFLSVAIQLFCLIAALVLVKKITIFKQGLEYDASYYYYELDENGQERLVIDPPKRTNRV